MTSSTRSRLIAAERDQDHVDLVVFNHEQVKSGQPVDIETFRAVVAGLVARGAELVLLECTELSVAAEDFGLLVAGTYIDSLDVLARRTIERSGRRVRVRVRARAGRRVNGPAAPGDGPLHARA